MLLNSGELCGPGSRSGNFVTLIKKKLRAFLFSICVDFVFLLSLDCCGSTLCCDRFRLHSPHKGVVTDFQTGKRIAKLLLLNL